MAHKRMFSKDITESDAFADMPLSTQALYFHLGMSADDDGFVNNAKKIQRGIGASPDDLNLLVAKRFIIPFDTGIVVIKHWKINNTVRSDRYTPTKYKEELAQLVVQENKRYSLKKDTPELLVSQVDTIGIPNSNQWETQNRIGKDRIGENRDILSGKPDCLPVKVKEIIDYLNSVLGTSYRASSKKNTSLIHARLNDGFTIDDFKAVIDKKAAAWRDDPKMAKYLRPETLFGTKFEGYLNELVTVKGVANGRFSEYD